MWRRRLRPARPGGDAAPALTGGEAALARTGGEVAPARTGREADAAAPGLEAEPVAAWRRGGDLERRPARCGGEARRAWWRGGARLRAEPDAA